jgi:hypothetical protein
MTGNISILVQAWKLSVLYLSCREMPTVPWTGCGQRRRQSLDNRWTDLYCSDVVESIWADASSVCTGLNFVITSNQSP